MNPYGDIFYRQMVADWKFASKSGDLNFKKTLVHSNIASFSAGLMAPFAIGVYHHHRSIRRLIVGLGKQVASFVSTHGESMPTSAKLATLELQSLAMQVG